VGLRLEKSSQGPAYADVGRETEKRDAQTHTDSQINLARRGGAEQEVCHESAGQGERVG
jgi:hypothetical protein